MTFSDHNHAADALKYAFTAWTKMAPPLHGRSSRPFGAIDFVKDADGTWRLPPIHFGFDRARPGSDQTAYWTHRS